MPAYAISGWREIVARVFAGFDVEYGLSPHWLVNPDTNRRLKLDYFFPDIGLAIRFVGLEGVGRRQRKSDEETAAEEDRERARAEVCRAHSVVLVSINPDGDPRTAIRSMELALTRASAQVAQSKAPHARKQVLMPRLSEARRRAGELSVRLTSPEKLSIYAEMWRDREASLAAPETLKRPAKPRAFCVGMEVLHERFGPGAVTATEPEGGDLKVTIDFVQAGVRSFYASLLDERKLQILE